MIEARVKVPQKSATKPCKIRLFSWNVNGLRAVLRKSALQQFLNDQNPDILCLQEIKCKPDQLTPLELAELENRYQIFWNPAARPGYSGTAIFVKKDRRAKLFEIALLASGETVSSRGLNPIPKAEETYIPDGDEGAQWNDVPAGLRQTSKETVDRKRASGNEVYNEGRILTLEFDNFFLVNVYTPNSKPDLSRLTLRHDDWDPDFKNLLKTLEKQKPVITCGDFNCAHKEIDLARPKTNHKSAGFTDEEREGVTNLINSGFIDTFREQHPEEKRYTWWSHWGKARENNVGWRIDYFFISESLKPNLKNAEIYEHQTGSDHCPISIIMEF